MAATETPSPTSPWASALISTVLPYGVKEMVRFLVEERHLSTQDAYMLTSIAVDLR
jgi:acetamidase/formamidase